MMTTAMLERPQLTDQANARAPMTPVRPELEQLSPHDDDAGRLTDAGWVLIGVGAGVLLCMGTGC